MIKGHNFHKFHTFSRLLVKSLYHGRESVSFIGLEILESWKSFLQTQNIHEQYRFCLRKDYKRLEYSSSFAVVFQYRFATNKYILLFHRFKGTLSGLKKFDKECFLFSLKSSFHLQVV